MGIQNELDKIKNAVYGVEIREAIHDGIKKAYDDASKDGNANIEVSLARGSYPTLGGRLDNLDQDTFSLNRQLAEKAEKKDLQSLSMAYKESYDTLAKLNIAYPTGDAFNHAVLSDMMIYTFLNGSGWVSTGVQANGTGIANYTVTKEKTDFIRISTNLLPFEDLLENTLPFSTDGSLITANGYMTTQPIPISAGEKIQLKDFYRWVTYNKSGVYQNVGVTSPVTIPTDGFIRVAFKNEQKDNVQMNKGSVLLPYEKPYGSYLKKEVKVEALTYELEKYLIEKFKEQSLTKPKDYVFSSQEILGDYTPITVDALDGTGIDGIDGDDIKVSQLYSLYEANVLNHTDYVSSRLLGNDQSGTLPIYHYSFRPKNPLTLNGKVLKEKPTILITNGIHGDGQDAGDRPSMLIAAYYFFKDLCNNWKDNEILEYLRWNVNFEYIPVVNPWGIDNKSRRNSRQVDLNRNFDNNHVVGTIGSTTYGGTAPFSEKETQYVRDFVSLFPNAVFHIDLHTTGGIQTQERMIYLDMFRDSEMAYPAFDLINRLSKKWNERGYAGLDTSIAHHGFIHDEPDAPIITNWIERKRGIPAAGLEAFPNFIGSGLTTFGTELMTMAGEEVGNFIWYSLKYFKIK